MDVHWMSNKLTLWLLKNSKSSYINYTNSCWMLLNLIEACCTTFSLAYCDADCTWERPFNPISYCLLLIIEH